MFFHFFLSQNNNENCAFKVPASEVVQFSKDSDGFFVFSCQFFLFPFEKIHILCIFSKVNKKKFSNWKTEITIRILGQFRFLLCGGFQITLIFIVFLLIENVGSYDSLLLHCVPTHHPPTIITEKNHIRYLCLLSTMRKVSWLLLGLKRFFWDQIGVEFKFQSIVFLR